MRGTDKASTARSSSPTLARQRKRFAIPALVSAIAALALALPGAAAADPLGSVTTFPTPTGSETSQIAAGPDGNLWFTQTFPEKAISRITPSGTITEFTAGLSAEAAPTWITSGPGGNLWFTEGSLSFLGGPTAIGRITPSGTITEFSTGGKSPKSIAAGPDGNIWYAAAGKNEKQTITLTAGGTIGGSYKLCKDVAKTECTASIAFSASSSFIKTALASLFAIDGNNFNATGSGSKSPVKRVVEFKGGFSGSDVETLTCISELTGTAPSCGIAETQASEPNAIARMTPTGTITEFPLAAGEPWGGEKPNTLATGPDGNLWFTIAKGTGSNAIGRITPTGTITEFTSGLNANATPVSIAAGPDGNVWFTDFGASAAIGRITPTGTITEFGVPVSPGEVGWITTGPDGNLWFGAGSELTGYKVGRFKTSSTTLKLFPVNPGTTSGAFGSDGNLWYTGAATPEVAKFGIEPAGPEFPLTVTKEGTGAGTVVSSPAGIECGATCNAEYEEGKKVTLTASPSANSVFLSWKGCEKGGAIGRQCTVTMDKAKTVIAKFGPTQSLTLTKAGTGAGTVKSSPSGVACDANCSSNVVAFTEGASVVLTATPAKSNTFTGWSGAGCEGTGTCTVTMSAAKEVTAEFASTKYALTLTKAGGGTGAVKSKPTGISCGATCSSAVASVYAGAEVEITATAGKGSTLNWATGSGTCTGSTSPCKVTMSEAKSLTAEFK